MSAVMSMSTVASMPAVAGLPISAPAASAAASLPVPAASASSAASLPACPVEVTLSMISNRWKTLIIRDLLEGTKRFSELQRSVGGISQKVLTQNLRAMEADGLVTRVVFAEVPPRVEYSLTPVGQSLEMVLDAMSEWGEEYKAAVRGGR